MSLADQVLAVNNDLPIRTHQPVHSGKVRSVYWLTESDSHRLIQEKDYDVAADAPLAIMVISDRISAFDCIWQGEGGLAGVPGKGAALNTISNHWFQQFHQQGLARSHILDTPHPHPLIWVVQKAQPIKIEAIVRGYITGSMWRAYETGKREFCGIRLPDGLQKDQPLAEPLITPSTKGILKDIPGVPEADDVNITRKDLEDHYPSFNFRRVDDIAQYETLLLQGFHLIQQSLSRIGQIFVDTKFEFGYATDANNKEQLIYMDEVGTPDSSRIWDADAYAQGRVLENSKESFRQFLLNHFPDPDILLNKARMPERQTLARDHALPQAAMMDLSSTYRNIAEKITRQPIKTTDNPRAEIIEILSSQFGLI